jgi:RimJ/RimL family protein N-acetyltransferase
MADSPQTRFGAAKREARDVRLATVRRSKDFGPRTGVKVSQSGFGRVAFVNGRIVGGVIETERLLLRAWQPSDAEPFAALNADPEVTRYLRGPLRRDESDDLIARIRAHWLDHGFGLYAVEVKRTGAFAGFVGLAVPSFLPDVLPAVEVGWRLAREHWGNGYATEGAAACLDHGFGELGLRQIISIIDPRNDASVRVAQRLDMTRGRDRLHPQTRVRVAIYAKNAEDAGSSRGGS